MTGKMYNEDYSAVYVGLPLTSDGSLFPTITHISSGLSPEHAVAAETSSSSSVGYGLFAFIIGTVLACFGWMANQGWSAGPSQLFSCLASSRGHLRRLGSTSSSPVSDRCSTR